MKKDIVVFRKFPDGDIIALFPDMIENRDKRYINSYMHIGQHSVASVELITELDIPTNKEIKALKMELKSIGYNI